MKAPVMDGVIERRLLVNYRVDPEVAARLLPAPLRPQIVNGWAVAGICLLRLGHLRPAGLPAFVGLRSENVAHRIAVEVDTSDDVGSGVFIPRRDSNARANVVIGGRLFPGPHHRARFRVEEVDDRVHIELASVDGGAQVVVTGERTDGLQGSELFGDLGDASEFFRTGSLGYSPRRSGPALDGVELETSQWRVDPVRLVECRSSYFDDPARFPPGSATLDSALLMRDIPARWRARPSLRALAATA